MAAPRESYLDQYRDEIIMLIRDRRYTPVRIRKFLEDKYGLEVPKSTLSVYMKSLPPVVTPENVPPEAEHFLEQYEVYQTLVDGMRNVTDLSANLHGRMEVLEDTAAERHKAFMEDMRRFVEALTAASDQRHELMTKALQKIYDDVQDLDAASRQRHEAMAKDLRDITDMIDTRNDALVSSVRAATQGLESPPDVRPAIATLQESLTQQAKEITAIRRSVGPVWSMVRKNAPWMKAFFFTGLFWLAVILVLMWQYNLWRFLPWKFR